MKRFLPALILAAIGLQPQAVFAQALNVVSVSPAVGAVAVPLETQVEIVFDDTLDTAADFDGDGPLAFFAIEPADSITAGPAQYSDDGTTVTFDVTHTADTDFTWVLSGAMSDDGALLCSPTVLSYTTADATGTARIEGIMTYLILTKSRVDCDGPFRDVAVLLDSEPGPEARIVAAANVVDGEFEFDGVRAGTYWPAGFIDFDRDGLFEPDYDFIDQIDSEVFGYHPDFQEDSADLTVAEDSDTMIYIGAIGGSAARGTELPGAARLTGNHPNPFRMDTQIGFRLERPMTASIEVFDVLGRRVDEIDGRAWAVGEHSVRWSAGGIAPGMYVVRLNGPDFVLTLPVLKMP